MLLVHACAITGSAFVLNYLWEIRQCPWFFIHRGGNGGQTAMVVAALVLSLFVESWALATSRWAYTDINPLVLGTQISVLPVAQLLLLLPLTFWLSRKVIRYVRPE